eukprot:COSAG06_NODE_1896_length_8121_cov_3.278733_2_plen_168_part_00
MLPDIMRTQSELLLSPSVGAYVRERSALVGASCLLYAAPGAVLLASARNPVRVAPQASAWAAQAGLSFSADYRYLQDESWVHAADRVWAVSLCLHQFRVLGTAVVVAGAWAPAAAFTALATSGIAALHNGRTTPSQREHELSHAAWHLLSVSAVVLGMRRFPAKWRR